MWNWSNGQAGARAAVLGGAHHGPPPARRLRPGVRPHRADDPGRGAGPADALRARRPPRAARPRRPATTASAPCADLADYHRLNTPKSRPRSRSWSRRGRCVPVEVEGWTAAGLPRTATPTCPAGSRARALLTPFDPVVWFRPRTERLFDFHYRIEIYVAEAEAGATATTSCRSCSATASSPASTSRPTGRRPRSSCRARTPSRGPTPAEVAPPLHEELGADGRWLGLDSVTVVGQRRPQPGAHGSGGLTPGPERDEALGVVAARTAEDETSAKFAVRRSVRSRAWSSRTGPSLRPGPGGVVVEVEAAGVNYVDALFVQGRYQIKPAGAVQCPAARWPARSSPWATASTAGPRATG